MTTQITPGDAFSQVVTLMDRLLAPDGCPWDRKQTLESLKPYLLEEAYEVVEAIDKKDATEHCEELGDVLFQVVFHAALQKQNFDVADVCSQVVTKMKRRHPHVFGEESVQSAEEVGVLWEKIKAAEQQSQGKQRRTLDGIPKSMPALQQCQKMGEKAAKVGFDWPDVAGVREKIAEEMAELDEALAEGNKVHIAHELGDVFFTLVRLASKLNLSAEEVLQQANQRFVKRFYAMEDKVERSGVQLKEIDLATMNQAWQAIKKEGDL